ncbi:hypothetical protein Tco_0892655 [Tanacetum coccineum]|uniref:Uncharacterized protein n=1 Tax=Tanacetum coccineum TaxID=301880 RepID=A0ABQ5C7V7_9ASTR
MTHPSPKRIPKAALMRSGIVSLTTVRLINIAQPKSTVNSRVNTVKDKNVNTAKPKAVVNTARQKAILNAVKPATSDESELWHRILDTINDIGDINTDAEDYINDETSWRINYILSCDEYITTLIS